MRIAVDSSAAFNQSAGIGRYARNVVPALMRALPEASAALFYAAEQVGPAPYIEAALSMFPDASRIRVHRSHWSRRRMDQIWFRAKLPFPVEFWTGRINAVYSPDFTAPPSVRAPVVITVHDLAFEIVPERAPVALRRYLSNVVPRQIERAAAIATVSETTKRDLVLRYGVNPERIAVIPNAADDRFFHAPGLTPEHRRALRVPERYLLMVGTIEPRKNHATLLSAIESLPAKMTPPLVIAGKVGWDAAEILAKATALQDAGRVILLDHVDDRVLPALYASAQAVIYPSWYEGFGLPVLEALASGTPVIASDVPAHREVAGGHATLVPPGDADAIAGAIASVVSSGDSEPSVVDARRMQARRYDWDRSGRDLASLLRKVART